MKTAGRAVVTAIALVLASPLLAACSSNPSTLSGTTQPNTSSSTSSSPASSTPDGSVLAPAGNADQTSPVDGISCNTDEQLAFHIHAHLAIYVNGAPKLLPPGIGIGPPLQFEQTSSGPSVASGSCFSWLHTHDSSGVVHIESPIQRVFTLGDLFDVWGQPLSASQVGPARGAVTATINGNPFAGDPRGIPLDAQNVIQLDVGTALPQPQPYTFASGS